MIGRRQLPVASAISPIALGSSFVDLLRGGSRARERIQARARSLVESKFGSRRAVLTDSGTSALVLALRLAAPYGGVVGFPGYACVDLAAAARFAGIRVRLYDLDPVTLSPDLDSVRGMLQRGVDAIVVAHLFGYAADVLSVRELAASAGATVIEDAAQGAGGSLGGTRLGSFGELAVVSFGRGKALCAGGGGALLMSSEIDEDRWAASLGDLERSVPEPGWSGLAKGAVQWALGRPSVYALPSMVPWLHLGEMVYHAASEPRPMAFASSSLIPSAFALEESDLETRRLNAAALDAMVIEAPRVERVAPIAGAVPGYLRYPVRDLSGRRVHCPALGVMRPYPRTLAEQHELQPILVENEPATPGASSLRSSLFTLPTHRYVDESDFAGLAAWLSLRGTPRRSGAASRR